MSSLSGNILYFSFMDDGVFVGIMYSSLFEFSELNLLSAFILCFGKSPSIIVLGHAPPVFSHFFQFVYEMFTWQAPPTIICRIYLLLSVLYKA